MAEPSATDTALAQGIDGLKIKGKCHLTAIVPEIRNYIYELAFTPDPDTNFFTAKPPSKALCLTNRKIYEETKDMYRNAYRTFWLTTHFTMDFGGLNEAGEVREVRAKTRSLLDSLGDEDIANIRFLHACETGFHDEPSEWKLLDTGVWHEINHRYPTDRRDWFLFDQKHASKFKADLFNVFRPIGMKGFWTVARFNSDEISRLKRRACKDSLLTKAEIIAVVDWLTNGIDEEEEEEEYTQDEVGASDRGWANWQAMKETYGF